MTRRSCHPRDMTWPRYRALILLGVFGSLRRVNWLRCGAAT